VPLPPERPLRILMASAELAPVARVGGLGEAVAGLVGALIGAGHEVVTVVPDYTGAELAGERIEPLDDLPEWCGPTHARRGHLEGLGEVVLIDRVGLARPHPYVDPATGEGWPDNDVRFAGFSAAVAALVRRLDPDIVHLHDWHTALVPAFLADPPPTVLTIHNASYQGVCGGAWLTRLPFEPWRWAWYGGCNPLVGGIRSADRVLTVSPTYAAELLTPEHGMGLHDELSRLGHPLTGMRNGIDTDVWDPGTDLHLPEPFDIEHLDGRAAARAALLAQLELPDDRVPILGVVARLVEQKGIDHLLGLVPLLATLPARLVVLGSGPPAVVEALQAAAAAHPGHLRAVTDRYDEPLAHLVFAGADLFCLPSRFEPCGLTQLQAMRYGAIPVVNPVGGLLDTVVDEDRRPGKGTGFVATSADLPGFVDAVHRGHRAVRLASRRKAVQRRAMRQDWSWVEPVAAHLELYRGLLT
jgi:starch synthase